MPCEEAPRDLVVTIQDGLVDDDLRLGAAVIVEVAPHRRDSEDWPAVMIGALVVAPDMPSGVPAVWATDHGGSRIMAVDPAAREYSTWDRSEKARMPEAEEARRCLPETE
jgi:hypothetical protein